jgi:hypothetical protein
MGREGLPRGRSKLRAGRAWVRGRGWHLRNAWLSGLVRPSSWGQHPLQAAPEHILDAHVARHTEQRNTSHVTRHTSHVTRHLDDIFMIVAGGGNEGGPAIVVLRVKAVPAVTCHTLSRRKQEEGGGFKPCLSRISWLILERLLAFRDRLSACAALPTSLLLLKLWQRYSSSRWFSLHDPIATAKCVHRSKCNMQLDE